MKKDELRKANTEQLFEALDYCGYDSYYKEYREEILSEIRARIEEKSKGKWRKVYLPLPLSDSVKEAYRCSECNLTYDIDTHYCPNCGANMKGEKE